MWIVRLSGAPGRRTRCRSCVSPCLHTTGPARRGPPAATGHLQRRAVVCRPFICPTAPPGGRVAGYNYAGNTVLANGLAFSHYDFVAVFLFMNLQMSLDTSSELRSFVDEHPTMVVADLWRLMNEAPSQGRHADFDLIAEGLLRVILCEECPSMCRPPRASCVRPMRPSRCAPRSDIPKSGCRSCTEPCLLRLQKLHRALLAKGPAGAGPSGACRGQLIRGLQGTKTSSEAGAADGWRRTARPTSFMVDDWTRPPGHQALNRPSGGEARGSPEHCPRTGQAINARRCGRC